MLTGNEKIKAIKSNDICNWLGNNLSAFGAKEVRIETENNNLGEYRVLYVVFKNYHTRIAFIGERALNSTIQEIRDLILINAEFQDKKTAERKCKYKFQDKEKFNGMPYCKFFNEYCEDVSFVCDKNCQVFAQDKRIEKLENLLNRCEQHNKEIVAQNQSLQSELRFATDNNKKDEEYIRQLEEKNMILEEKVQELKYFMSHPTFFISKVGADEDLFKFIVRSATKQNLIHIEMEYALPPEKAQMKLSKSELEDLLYAEVENAVRRDRSKRITFERVRNERNEVEVDLAEYEDEIRDYLNGTIKEDLLEYVRELEKELYFYHTKSNITVEKIYNDLKRIVEEN